MKASSSFLAAVLVAALQTLSCSGSDDTLAAALRAEVRTAGPAGFCMSAVASFDWETVVIFPPYTSAETMVETLGFPWPDAEDVDLSDDEGAVVLVFVQGQRVVRHVLLRRSGADFAQQSTANFRQLARSSALFRVEREEDSTRVVLVPEEKLDGVKCP